MTIERSFARLLFRPIVFLRLTRLLATEFSNLTNF